MESVGKKELMDDIQEIRALLKQLQPVEPKAPCVGTHMQSKRVLYLF